MIYLKKPYIIGSKTKSKLYFDFEIDKIKKSVWFEVEDKYKEYLCDDRVDAIFVGLLSYALRNNHDIKSDSIITEDILYKVKEYLIPSLTKYSENLHKINIDIKPAKAIKNVGGVGTGCSCGIDSFHAILKHNKTEIKDYNLTHICINNVGAFNECYKESGIDKVRKIRVKKAKECAKELGLPIIITDSNFQDEIPQNHSLTHTYSSTFAILCLQKLWGKYYYGSSGIDLGCFDLKENDKNDCCKYEILSLDCFSTNNLKIFSEGGAQDRVEKTKEIYTHPLVKKYLHVCTIKEYNCSVCPKCMRTLLTLYALTDDMKQYKNVFDIDYFLNNKEEYFEWLYAEHCYDTPTARPVYKLMLEKKDFYEYIKDREEERIKWLESQSESYYKDEYEKIINSKSYRVYDKLMKIPRKLKKIVIHNK